ncbi:MAG: transglutaminase-like domain-containing protein, partial [Kofleriaceae bacterium]
MRALVVIFVTACTAPLAAHDVHDVRDAPELHADQTRYYSIWLGGARVGTATEQETWSTRGVALVRTEEMRFLRGETEVALATTIVIDADTALVAQRVRWSETAGGVTRSAEVDHDERGWHGAAIAGEAVPAELVPLLVRRDGHFTGDVFLPARNFVGGRGRIDAVAPDRLVARLELSGGPLAEATIDRAPDGMPARVVDGEIVIALRITAAQARSRFVATDLVAATAVPISGARRTHHHLVLEGELVLPALPGQRTAASTAGLAIELGAELPGALPAAAPGRDRAGEIRTLVASVHARITPDLGATPTSSRDADAATAGDCTTFALAYAALATRRGIPTRVVTGLRVDGDRLVRHRWAVSWTGRAWIAVDAAFGAAPAGG